MATVIDLDKLDYATLKKLAEDAAAKAEEKRSNELKTLVNGWKLKAEQNGFSVAEVVSEFEAYIPSSGVATKKARAPRGSVMKDEKPYVKGVAYTNPKGGDVWVGGSKGRQPPWLRDLVPDTLSHEAKVKKFESLAVK